MAMPDPSAFRPPFGAAPYPASGNMPNPPAYRPAAGGLPYPTGGNGMSMPDPAHFMPGGPFMPPATNHRPPPSGQVPLPWGHGAAAHRPAAAFSHSQVPFDSRPSFAGPVMPQRPTVPMPGSPPSSWPSSPTSSAWSGSSAASRPSSPSSSLGSVDSSPGKQEAGTSASEEKSGLRNWMKGTWATAFTGRSRADGYDTGKGDSGGSSESGAVGY